MSDTASERSPAEPLGFLVARESGHDERRVPIYDQLFVGRECVGIGDKRRLLIDNPEVSRSHVEIRLDSEKDQAFVIDTSTNGTLLNGARLDRAVPISIKPGDEIRIGDVLMTFISSRFTTGGDRGGWQTSARITPLAMAMVVGVITNYSAMSQVTDHTAMAESLDVLSHEWSTLLRTHQGTLSHYGGEELYAVWELQTISGAEELAIDFALAANKRVEELGPELPLRCPDDTPIHAGWGVVKGMAALTPITRRVETVLGDATNVAFRLANIAGRDGLAPVLVGSSMYAETNQLFEWGDPEEIPIKGRVGLEKVFPVVGRKTTAAATHETSVLKTARITTCQRKQRC